MQSSALLTLLLALLALPPLRAETGSRQFNSKDGKPLEAELIEATDTGVTLRRASDAKEFKLPLDRLSDADQAWLKEWRARNEPVPHPLGWKRLRIHAENSGILFGHSTIIGVGMWEVEELREVYLPVGTWVNLQVSSGGRSLQSLVRYDGAADWYLEDVPGKILLRNSPAAPQRVASIQYRGPDEGVNPSLKTKPLTARECLPLIEAGATVSTTSTSVGELAKLRANPQALYLEVGHDGIRWEEIPRSVRALSLSGGREIMDLAGIEALTQLEDLEISIPALTGMEALQKLPKLEMLAVRSTVDPGQVAHLGKLANLRHLGFLEGTKSLFPEDAFDVLGELTRLESANLGSHYVWDKRVNPSKAFRNCPNLTIYRLNRNSITDQGAFLEHLPKLTEASFAGGMIPRERAAKLMDAGHFKFLRSLETPSHYPLRNLPNLQWLVTQVYPRGKNFEEFAELPALRELSLTNARNEDLGKLAVHPAFAKVETLWLSRPTADDFSGLRGMPALDHLVLFYGQGSRADLSALAPLKRASISNCSQLTELKLPANLEDLRINSSHALELGPVSALPHLRRLHLENCDGVKTLEPLAPCPELAEMVLINCKRLTATAGLEKGPRIKRCVIQGCGGAVTREGAE